MRRFNKFLSLVLCAALILSALVLPMEANAAFPESPHPYMNNMDNEITSYVYDEDDDEDDDDADEVGALKIHFSPETETADGSDTISVFASGNRLVGFFSEKSLADKTLLVPGRAVYVALFTNGSGTAYGYKVDSIEPLRSVTFSFDTNGGSRLDSIRAAYLEKEPLPEKQGVFFAGWYDNAELSGEPVSFPYISSGDTTLYAAWSDEPFINFNDFLFEISDDGAHASVFKYTGTRQTVHLPTKTADGIPVTEINSNAFEKSIAKTVVINEAITEIDSFAFNNCRTLQSIEVDINNPKYASKDGMLYNKSLKTLLRCPVAYEGSYTLPATVTALNSGVFDGCALLTRVELTSDITEIPDFAFRNCLSLTETVIPKTVISVGEQAFYGCAELEEPKLPTGITVIGKNAFTGTGLYNKSENWKNGILYKDSYLLATDKAAVSGEVTVANGTLCIANNAFYQNAAVTKVNLPGSLKTICPYAFYGCSGITEILLPISLKTVGNYAFAKCTSLKSLYIPAGVSTLGRMGTFDGCASLESVFVGYGIKDLPVNAFKNCAKLSSVTLTGNLKTVGIGAFGGCSALSELKFMGFESQWQALKIASGNAALTALSPSCSETEPWIKGDLNSDGKVNSADSMYLKAVIIGARPAGEFAVFASDLNNDGKINSFDSLMLKKVIMGIIKV